MSASDATSSSQAMMQVSLAPSMKNEIDQTLAKINVFSNESGYLSSFVSPKKRQNFSQEIADNTERLAMIDAKSVQSMPLKPISLALKRLVSIGIPTDHANKEQSLLYGAISSLLASIAQSENNEMLDKALMDAGANLTCPEMLAELVSGIENICDEHQVPSTLWHVAAQAVNVAQIFFKSIGLETVDSAMLLMEGGKLQYDIAKKESEKAERLFELDELESMSSDDESIHNARQLIDESQTDLDKLYVKRRFIGAALAISIATGVLAATVATGGIPLMALAISTAVVSFGLMIAEHQTLKVLDSNAKMGSDNGFTTNNELDTMEEEIASTFRP